MCIRDSRKTWDSIQRLLPGRTTVIVTRQSNFNVDGAIVVGSLEDALSATEDESPFVVGGAEIYRLAMPHVSRIYLTRVHADIEGDTVMPDIDFNLWQQLESTSCTSDEKNSHDYSFEIYENQPIEGSMNAFGLKTNRFSS